MTRPVLFALALAAPTVAPAQTVAPDPARLAAARELIDTILPPATREQMITGMLAPMLANMRQGLQQNPGFAQAMQNPKEKALFDSFMAKEQQRVTETMREALPGMVPAMAAAYARRFDVGQLHEIKAFFQTPTGRAYMTASYTIMSDPDIAAWQRGLMATSMQHVQEDVQAFAQQAAAAEKQP
jgi:hypothetical protein